MKETILFLSLYLLLGVSSIAILLWGISQFLNVWWSWHEVKEPRESK